jgi:hypothetical protein
MWVPVWCFGFLTLSPLIQGVEIGGECWFTTGAVCHIYPYPSPFLALTPTPTHVPGQPTPISTRATQRHNAELAEAERQALQGDGEVQLPGDGDVCMYNARAFNSPT